MKQGVGLVTLLSFVSLFSRAATSHTLGQRLACKMVAGSHEHFRVEISEPMGKSSRNRILEILPKSPVSSGSFEAEVNRAQTLLKYTMQLYNSRKFDWQTLGSVDELIEGVKASASTVPSEDASRTLAVVDDGNHSFDFDIFDGAKFLPVVKTKGKKDLYFFSVNHPGNVNAKAKVRSTWIVELIREALGSKSAPKAYFGSLHGVNGIFVEKVQGGVLAEYTGTLEQGPLVDLIGLTFIVRHNLTHLDNFLVQNKEVVGIDFENVLNLAENRDGKREAFSPFGFILPPLYTPSFIRAVKSITPADAVRRWGGKMTRAEIESFLLLREVILLDFGQKKTIIGAEPLI